MKIKKFNEFKLIIENGEELSLGDNKVLNYFKTMRNDLFELSLELRDEYNIIMKFDDKIYRGSKPGMERGTVPCLIFKSINPSTHYTLKWNNDIKDCFLRYKEYLGNRYIGFSYTDYRSADIYINLDENTEINSIIKQIHILYKTFDSKDIISCFESKKSKKSKKIVIKKVTKSPYNWQSTFDRNSPAPGYQINMINTEIPLNTIV